jgi:hypothetical protein
MAQINFPNSPALNQEFVADNTTYLWDGTKWVVKTSSLSLNFIYPSSEERISSFTLNSTDEGKILRVNSSSNLVVTIPLNSSVNFPINGELALIRYGTGEVSITPISGVTLNSKNTERNINGRYGAVALKKIDTDEWLLIGSLE